MQIAISALEDQLFRIWRLVSSREKMRNPGLDRYMSAMLRCIYEMNVETKKRKNQSHLNRLPPERI